MKKTGRPAFKPTAEMRRQVSIAAGGGMSHEEIAIALGISKPTLSKHFEAELSVAALKRRLEVMAALHAKAMKGNVSAQKAYLAMSPSAAAAPEAPEEPEAAPAGKKAQANANAKTAQIGTTWEDVLPGIHRPAVQ